MSTQVAAYSARGATQMLIFAAGDAGFIGGGTKYLPYGAGTSAGTDQVAILTSKGDLTRVNAIVDNTGGVAGGITIEVRYFNPFVAISDTLIWTGTFPHGFTTDISADLAVGLPEKSFLYVKVISDAGVSATQVPTALTLDFAKR